MYIPLAAMPFICIHTIITLNVAATDILREYTFEFSTSVPVIYIPIGFNMYLIMTNHLKILRGASETTGANKMMKIF